VKRGPGAIERAGAVTLPERNTCLHLPPSNPSSCCFIISDATTMTSKFTVHRGVVHSGLTSATLLITETKVEGF